MSAFSNQEYGYVENGADAVVREYETRYARKSKAKNDEYQSYGDGYRNGYDVEPTAEERKWAMLAHLSAWLILLGGMVTLGAIIPITIFIPLGIYFKFRDQSDYVAYHALQAFAIQVVGTVGVVVLLTVGSVIWVVGLVVSILLMLVLVGFLIMPLWVIAGVLFFIFAGTLPITMLVFASFAAMNTHNGGDYRYPVIGRWIDRRLENRVKTLFV